MKTLGIFLVMLFVSLTVKAEEKTAPVPAPADPALEILKKMDAVRDYKTARMKAVMRIVNSDGDETKMELISTEQTDGDKGLMRFTFPARLKGTAILTVGDEIWYYNKRTNRVRLLSRSAKKGSMMGSSFSYDDMTTDYVKDFTAKILKDESDHWVLKMIPKDSDKKYAHLIAVVQKATHMGTKVEYFKSGAETPYKVMIAKNIKEVKGHQVALKVKMTELGSQKTTFFETSEASIEYDVELSNDTFSERTLKQ